MLLGLILGLAAGFPPPTPAQEVESLCARVQLEIRQELALERQAFDARLRIHNQLPALSIDNVAVAVVFTDNDGNPVTATSDPADTNALFFISLAVMDNISRIDGAGTVAPQTAAEIRWLIIPAPGAGGELPQGTRYFVGANFNYTIGGEPQSMEVAPDTIYVRPMPRLLLDYFLPINVFADDPFSPEVEPPVPFSLGVRVLNAGHGTAPKLAIDSGQPNIVDNTLGLLVGFRITSSEVNGASRPASLKAEFGDVPAAAAAVARWTMETTLSGSFTNFTADFIHADAYGGELTSLIDDIQTHALVRDVLVDLPGRDAIRDFLARQGAGFKVYESDGTDTPVADRSFEADLAFLGSTGSVSTYRLTVPATSAPFCVKKDWEGSPDATIQSVVRDDGKRINAANYWISRSRVNPTSAYDFAVNLFDVDRGGVYTLSMTDTNVPNLAPLLASIGPQVTRVGIPLEFRVSAADPNGTFPQLTMTPLPAGASFMDGGAGSADFAWTPAAGQNDVYPVRVVASDGEFEDSSVVKIYVGLPDEPLGPGGIPESLAGWTPQITAILAASASGAATVQWATAESVAYNLYYSDSPFGSNMAWQIFQSVSRARPAFEEAPDLYLGTNRMSRFYGVRLADDPPGSAGTWGVIRRHLRAASYTMVSAPLRMDRRFDGELGEALATVLHGHDGGPGDLLGDEVYAMNPDGSWRSLYLDSAGVWREEDGQPSTFELGEGQGMFVARQTPAAALITFAGQVGDQGVRTNTVRTGWNILSLSEGEIRGVEETFADGSDGGPYGAAMEELADLIVIQQPNGSWQRLMFVDGWGVPLDGHWIDLDTGEVANPHLEPGQAYYYFRQSVAGPMEVEF